MSLIRTLVRRTGGITPPRLRRMLNLWPPLLASGIRITHIAEDWSAGRLELRMTPLNANMHGAAFGGTLFSMTDVLFGTLMMQRLGAEEFEAWTRTGSFEFIRPGRDGAAMTVEIPEEMVERILADLEGGYSTVVQCTSVIRNVDGTLVGIGQQDLYVRRRGGVKPPPNPNLLGRVRGENLSSAARTLARMGLREHPERLVEHERVARRCISPEARAVAWLQGVPGEDADFRAAGLPEDVMAALREERPGPAAALLLEEVAAARASLAEE
ncbi:hypothetical protein CSPHI_10345 [Corynebacterium sphenisci DSM 44792]|uniref:DUF4442 domain-containing protein n=1 Tax=Corynebacterium sphenisci DSM 44792 TaxID=1437874 RepID=A0A1L7CZT5_9CORY|nr:DUF4442 domain-containing protein [Corynebacterium sphenisci]APT91330.1 hypothetical protein CSPHI_10345 [Corynebacterium sphenisci DSM 44792]